MSSSPKPDIHPCSASKLLDRAEAFLPTLAKANEQLQDKLRCQPDILDIEHLTGGSACHIEMELACGVVELRDQAAAAAAQAASRGAITEPASESSTCSDESSSDGSSSDEIDSAIDVQAQDLPSVSSCKHKVPQQEGMHFRQAQKRAAVEVLQ